MTCSFSSSYCQCLYTAAHCAYYPELRHCHLLHLLHRHWHWFIWQYSIHILPLHTALWIDAIRRCRWYFPTYHRRIDGRSRSRTLICLSVRQYHHRGNIILRLPLSHHINACDQASTECGATSCSQLFGQHLRSTLATLI